MNTFSIKESIKYGWEVLKNNKSIWVATLAMFVLMVLAGGPNRRGFGFVSFLACIALLVARIGYTKLILKIKDGETFEWPQALEVMFNTHKVFWKYIGVSILYGIFTVIGFILLIIPGFFVLTIYSMAPFLVIDNGMRPMAALKESKVITKGSRLKIFWFMIVVGVLNMLGAVALGVGLFITIPVTLIAFAHVYRGLLATKTSPAVSA